MGFGKKWALTKMIEFLPYRVVRMILTKEFLKRERERGYYLSNFSTRIKQETVRAFYCRVQLTRNRKTE